MENNYFKKLRAAAEDEILIETSPQYALSSKALDASKSKEQMMELRLAEAKAMKALNPFIKVIVILCDPIKRAFSMFSMNARNWGGHRQAKKNNDNCRFFRVPYFVVGDLSVICRFLSLFLSVFCRFFGEKKR